MSRASVNVPGRDILSGDLDAVDLAVIAQGRAAARHNLPRKAHGFTGRDAALYEAGHDTWTGRHAARARRALQSSCGRAA